MMARLQDSTDPAVNVAVAYSPHVTPETRDRLLTRVKAEAAAGSIDAHVALHWSPYEPSWLQDAPLTERLTYLDCPHAAFRRVLAASPHLPDQAWQKLDDDPDISVRRTAARRPDTPSKILLRLLRTHGDASHTRPLLVQHPNFPQQELHDLAHEPNPRVRLLALEDPELPVPELRHLASGEESFLRTGAARHPNITTELLQALLADPVPEVAEEAAVNPTLPPAWMDRILVEAGL